MNEYINGCCWLSDVLVLIFRDSCLCDQSMMHVTYLLRVVDLTIQEFLRYGAWDLFWLFSVVLFLLCVMSI